MADPDSGTSTYTYYDDGLLNTRTDLRGEVVTTTYDGLGRLATKAYSGPMAAPTITYTYDTCQLTCQPDPPQFPKGRLTMISYFDNSQKYRYQYDSRGRVTNKLSEIDGVGYGVQHGYDSMDRELTTWYHGGESVSRTYDSQGLVESVWGMNTYLTSTDYGAGGQLTRLTFGNTKQQNFTYFPDMRLATLSVNATTPATMYSYTYDAKGNMKSLTDSSITLSNKTTTFTYDERDRLTSVGMPAEPTSSTFEYDAIGNMKRKDEGAIQGVRETAAQCQSPADDDNDGKINDGCTTGYSTMCYSPQQSGCAGVVSGRPHAVKRASGNNPNFTYSNTFGANYSYDDIGNLVEINAPSDPELGLLVRNRKTGEPGGGYDAEGRLWKVEYNKLDAGSSHAFYDLTGDCQVTTADRNAIQQGPSWNKSVGQTGYNPLYDLNSSGSVFQDDLNLLDSVMNKTCPTFTYDPNGQLVKQSGPKNIALIDGIYEKDLDSGVETKYYFGPGGRVAMQTGGVVRYLANDHLGSTSFVMNGSGGLETHVRYYPYGMTWSQSAAPATDRLFTGHQQMGAKSGTYYANARFYSADIGQFPQADSVVGGGYAYAGNNPANYVDPTGNDIIPSCVCPAGGLNGGGTSGGWGGPHPLTSAMAMIGLSDPIDVLNTDDACYVHWAADFCWPTHDAWNEMTLWAAGYLQSFAPGLGMLLNDLPWSPTQRVALGGQYGIDFQPATEPERVRAMHRNIEKLAALEAAVLPATGGPGPVAVGRAFETVAFAFLRQWGMDTGRFTISSATKTFRIVDGTISPAGRGRIVVETKYRSAGATIYQTKQIDDYFASGYQFLLAYPSHARLSRGLQEMLVKRGAIWWTYPR